MKGNLSQNRLDDRNTSRSGIAFSPSIISGITGVVDAVIIFVVGFGMWITYLGYSPDSAPFYFTNIFLNTMMTVPAFYIFGLYNIEYLTSPGKHIGQITAICISIFTILVVLAFALKISTEYSRVWFFSTVVLEIFLISLFRLWLNSFIQKKAESGIITRRIALVGATEQASHFIHALRITGDPWNHIIGVFDDEFNPNETKPTLGGIEYGGDINALIDFSRKNRVDEIIICFPWSETDEQIKVINKLSDLPIHIRLAPDNISYHIANHSMSTFAGVPVLDILQRPISGWKNIVKNIEDKILGLIFLIVALPLFLIIIVLIKLNSSGPAIFTQKRYGFNNQLIDIYKFRTMYVDPEDTGLQATRGDSRITSIGFFLRRWSIDELPQLFNVMNGSMSLIGPRPLPVSQNEELSAVIDNYFSRHRIKPGITGWAQIHGLRGAKTVEDMKLRLKYDVAYAENWSLWNDIWILAKTAVVVSRGENAY